MTTAEQLAAIEALCDEADAGEGIVIYPGHSEYHVVETGLIRAILAGSEQATGAAAVQHRPDESKPTTFMRHVGPVYTCTCGRDVVAGYPCAGDSS